MPFLVKLAPIPHAIKSSPTAVKEALTTLGSSVIIPPRFCKRNDGGSGGGCDGVDGMTVGECMVRAKEEEEEEEVETEKGVLRGELLMLLCLVALVTEGSAVAMNPVCCS